MASLLKLLARLGPNPMFIVYIWVWITMIETVSGLPENGQDFSVMFKHYTQYFFVVIACITAVFFVTWNAIG